MVQPMLPFKKILIKREYGSTHIVFNEIVERKTVIRLNQGQKCLKTLQRLSHITLFLSPILIKTIWVEVYCPLIKILLKGNMSSTIWSIG